jgi:hypothetical protein
MYVHTDAIRHVDSRRSCGVGQAVFVNGTRRVEAVFAETQVQICVADVEKREMVQMSLNESAGNGKVKGKVSRVVCNCNCAHTRQAA